jgi:hypothetical protein
MPPKEGLPWQVVECNGRVVGVPPVVRGAQSYSGQPESASAPAGRMPGWQAQGCKPHGLPHGALWPHGPRLLFLHPALVNLARGHALCGMLVWCHVSFRQPTLGLTFSQ